MILFIYLFSLNKFTLQYYIINELFDKKMSEFMRNRDKKTQTPFAMARIGGITLVKRWIVWFVDELYSMLIS